MWRLNLRQYYKHGSNWMKWRTFAVTRDWSLDVARVSCGCKISKLWFATRNGQRWSNYVYISYISNIIKLYQTTPYFTVSFDPYPCDIMWRCRPPLQVISVEQVLQHENLEENDLKSLLCSSYHFGEVGWFFGWCNGSASARRCKLKNMAMSETISTIFIGKIQQYTAKQW